jgi:UDP-N-acetylglucosamine 2-epimerase (non-hydrolysing)
MNSCNITCVVGARPNFIKIAAILREFGRRPEINPFLIHTGQHFSPEMSATFFEDLDIPQPDLNLEIGPGSPTVQTAEMMKGLEAALMNQRPDLVLVVGDVNSTLAAALVAPKLGVPLAHVEAGLRSFDRSMPEELNRVLTDAVSDYLFVSEPSGLGNLRREGVPDSKVFFTGNVMIDTLLRFRDRAMQSDILDRMGVEPGKYALVTLHRPGNVDDPERLSALTQMLMRLSTHLPVVFPVHPRTRQKLPPIEKPMPHLKLVPPAGYLDFMKLMSQARIVLTDSGGIQEETTILGTQCITVRENTERPVTIEQGTNHLAGVDPERVLAVALDLLACAPRPNRTPDLWDGRASVRIADVLEAELMR